VRRSVDNAKEEIKYTDIVQPDVKDTESKHINSIKQQFSSFDVKKDQDTFSAVTQQECSKEFIRTHAFITSSFKSNLVENRCNGLLNYDLDSSFSFKVKSCKLIWVHKMAFNDNSSSRDMSVSRNNIFNDRLKSLKLGDSINSSPVPNRGRMSTNEICEDNLKELDDPFEVSDMAVVDQVLSSHLHIVFEVKAVFYGLQYWKMKNASPNENLNIQNPQQVHENIENINVPNEDNSETQKCLTITKIDIQNCSIFTKIDAEVHPILTTADSEKFMEFYLWNKR
jgi:hypothetical protein